MDLDRAVAVATADGIPAGWTLVDEIIGPNGRSGLRAAPGDVTDLTRSFAVKHNIAGCVLGYEACSVPQHAAL